MTSKEKSMSTVNFLNLFEKAWLSKDLKLIRFVKKSSYNYYSGRTTMEYGYFDLNDEGIIISCERGYSCYKGMKLVNLKEAYEDDVYKMKDIFTGSILQ